MTAMAGNPLIVELAEKSIGAHLTWSGWALAAIVPGLVGLILIPYMLYKLYPPQIHDMPHAREMAIDE